MINNLKRRPISNFSVTEKKVAKLGFTLYKNNDSRGKYYIAQSCEQYDGGNNTPRYFNTIPEIEENWLKQRSM